ncbi:MAG: beta-lactamase family protein [Deltaproteobacteria bacterium]|nr:beta-lactamase family protein [Deltaproteobacteria bacterium]MBI3389539.1 beta-lactamase family protein [Deltaproteobacteria bacterium]
MRLPFVTACRVPASLESVTAINRQAEVEPRDVGVKPAAVAGIWGAVEKLYQSGLHPAIQLCVRHRGAVLIDRAIGHASGNGPHDQPEAPKILATPVTPFNVFSASKAITAMLIHLLDQRNLIRLDDPVCEYIPEFGTHGKQWITIRHVLAHRAGIPNLPPEAMDLDLLADWDRIVALLCAAEPTSRPGRQLAYHAITGGFALGEVVRRVTGKTVRTLLDEEIRRPLGLRWLSYGVRKSDVARVARNYFTGPPALPPLSTVLNRALGVPFTAIADLANDPRFLIGIVPSGNIIATASDLSSFYQLLLNGGELNGVRIFEPRTIRRATGEQSYLEIDFTLGLPFRYGMGFMLGGEWFSPFGSDTRYAFGHLGFTNIVAWADPERQAAVALMTSGKPLVYPELYHMWDLLQQIGRACPKTKGSRVQGIKGSRVRTTKGERDRGPRVRA